MTSQSFNRALETEQQRPATLQFLNWTIRLLLLGQALIVSLLTALEYFQGHFQVSC